MKVYVLLFLIVLTSSLRAQDTITFKSGRVVTGKVLAMTRKQLDISIDGKTKHYASGDVAKMVFHSTVSNGKVMDDEVGAVVVPDAPDTHNNSYNMAPEATNNEPGKGVITFQCNQCGNSGRFYLRSVGSKEEKTTCQVNFDHEKDGYSFTHKEKLKPGNYVYTYKDNKKNQTEGKLTVQEGDVRTITFFEDQKR